MTKTTTTTRPGFRTMVRPLAADVGIPVAVYYGARALGLGDFVALTAGTVACVARIVWVALRRRNLDVFAAFLLVLFAAGLGLAFFTGDQRFMLVKESVVNGVAGLVFLASCLTRSPLCYYAAQRFAGPDAAAELRARTAAEPALRRRWYVLSAGWGGGLLAEAALRVPLVYLLPVDIAVAASTALMVATYGVLIMWTIRGRGARP